MAPFSAKQHHELRSLGFTLAALMLLIPTYLYPFMTMYHAGQYKKTIIWDGIRSLYDSGMWATATIVFMASIIIPIFKLVALLFIILTRMFDVARVERTSLLIFVDFIGRWSMLDIFLLAIMVALVKFGSFATVRADVSSYLLGAVVIFTMLASATLSWRPKEQLA